MLDFEWDTAKADNNLQKHGISFDEAKTVFRYEFAWIRYDTKHSQHEQRFLIIGLASIGQVLVNSYTLRGQNIRLISSRRANEKE